MNINFSTASRSELADYIIEVMQERNDYAKQLANALEAYNETLRSYKAVLSFANAVKPYMDPKIWCELLEKHGMA